MFQRVLLAAFAFWMPALLAAVPWHQPLSLANEGYWTQRLALRIENPSSTAVAGEPIVVATPTLEGSRIAALRVCRADGVELLFDVQDASGAVKHVGSFSAADRLVIPIECAAHSNATVFVYAGNNAAWPVPDYLPRRTNNPDFAGAVQITVGELERLTLRQSAEGVPAGPEFSHRAEILARNFSEKPVLALVRVNVRQALARWPGLSSDTAVRVIQQARNAPAYRLGSSGNLLIAAELQPRTEERIYVGFGTRTAGEHALTDYERLLSSPANLVTNGNLEAGRETPDGFKPSSGGSPVTTRFSPDARFGRRSVELTVPAEVKPNWVGWQSQPIVVRPGATYLFSGWLKGVGLKGVATLHAHFHDAQGGLTRSGAMASTAPGISGDADWTPTTGFLTAPPDAATIRLHLTMNTHGTLRHDGIVLCEVIEGVLGQLHSERSAPASPGTPLDVWAVNPLIKVFPDTPPQDRTRAVSVELAQNEYEPVQLAVRGRNDATGRVTVTVSALTNATGSAMPAATVERVGFVPVDHPSGYYTTDVPDWCRKLPRGAGSTDGWAGEWPDPLIPGGTFSIAPNRTQPLWLTFRSERNTAAGEYRGAIELRWNGATALTLPIRVNVLPFALPDRTHLKAVFDLRRGPGGWFGHDARAPAEREKWLRFIAAHRLGINAIEPSPRFSYTNGQVTMDTTEFDVTAKLCFDELGMNVSYTPQFFYMFGWAYPPKKLFGLEPFTVEWTRALQQAYRLFTDHVRANGWHDKFIYYISDEPHFDQAFVVDQMQKLCALIHGVDREIPIFSSTWRHCAAWDDSLDLWGVGQHGTFPVPEMTRLQAAGKKTWFTCDGQQATDTPYLATERMLPYYCFKYGASGFEFWGISWWTYDPWQRGWHWFIRQSDDGKRQYWIRYPNGDGYLAYPGKSVGVDGPVSTIRLEQVREGLEDYEALALLKEQAEKAQRAGKSAVVAERAFAMARDLVTIPNAGGLRSTEILPDPERIPAIRRAVNAALVELRRHP